MNTDQNEIFSSSSVQRKTKGCFFTEVEQTKPKEGGRDNRLWRRFRQVEKLSPAQRKPIIQVLDAFLQGTAPKRG